MALVGAGPAKADGCAGPDGLNALNRLSGEGVAGMRVQAAVTAGRAPVPQFRLVARPAIADSSQTDT